MFIMYFFVVLTTVKMIFTLLVKPFNSSSSLLSDLKKERLELLPPKTRAVWTNNSGRPVEGKRLFKTHEHLNMTMTMP